MAAETQTQAPAATAASNGRPQAAPGEEPCEDCATPSERVMGIIGLLFALGLAAIAIDLISGGAVSRAVGGALGKAVMDDGGQP